MSPCCPRAWVRVQPEMQGGNGIAEEPIFLQNQWYLLPPLQNSNPLKQLLLHFEQNPLAHFVP